uniref:AAA+ ATPase domain-containing protein n=1 Tax=Parascaris univalens TaxID=6257 RepID=A0A915B5C4_PARUN
MVNRRNLRLLFFHWAQKFQPTIIFIDEIDSFLRDRQAQDHEATAMMKAEFMSLWDGFASSDNAIIVMGATNRPYDVDKAILRRMPARFYVPLPDAQSRADILKVILRREPMESGINFQRIAEAASNLSGSDLKEVCRLAVLSRVKNAVAQGCSLYDETARMLREEDLIRAVVKYTETALTSKMPLLIPESLD